MLKPFEKSILRKNQRLEAACCQIVWPYNFLWTR